MQHAAPKSQANNEVPELKGLPLVGNLPQFQRQPLTTLIRPRARVATWCV